MQVKYKILIYSISIILLLGAGAFAGYQFSRVRIDPDYQDRIIELEESNKRLGEQLNSATESNRVLREELARSRRLVDGIRHSIEDSFERIGESNSSIERIDIAVQSLEDLFRKVGASE